MSNPKEYQIQLLTRCGCVKHFVRGDLPQFITIPLAIPYKRDNIRPISNMQNWAYENTRMFEKNKCIGKEGDVKGEFEECYDTWQYVECYDEEV